MVLTIKAKTYGLSLLILTLQWGRDSSVGKSSASHAGNPGSNPGGGLTRVIQSMNERGKRLPVSLADWCIMILLNLQKFKKKSFPWWLYRHILAWWSDSKDRRLWLGHSEDQVERFTSVPATHRIHTVDGMYCCSDHEFAALIQWNHSI